MLHDASQSGVCGQSERKKVTTLYVLSKWCLGKEKCFVLNISASPGGEITMNYLPVRVRVIWVTICYLTMMYLPGQ